MTQTDYVSAEGVEAGEPLRRSLLTAVTFDVLKETSDRIPFREVLKQVRDRIELNPVELSHNTSGQERFDTFIGFMSGWANKVGWISKHRDGWQLTPAGQHALESVGRDELYTELTRLYQKAHKAEKEAAALGRDAKYSRLFDVVAVVGAGEWTTQADISEVTGVGVDRVAQYLSTVPAGEGHRVLTLDGHPDPEFRWPDGRQETQRDALEAEGLEFSPDGAADPAARVWAGDLRERVEELLPRAAKRAWLIRGSSVNGRDLVPVWRERGSVSLAATKLRPVEAGLTRAELKNIVDDDYSQASYAAKAAKVDEFHAFLTRMNDGDIVATTSQGRMYLGTVAGDPTYAKSEDGRSNLRRAVQWADDDGIDYPQLPGEISARLQVQHEVVEMTEQLDLLEELLAAGSVVVDKPGIKRELVLPEANDDLARELHVARAWLQESIDLLRERKQLIYYGPPGTGKTYIALKLAEHLGGDNVRLVQFHPAYTYEDFFEGYRPVPSGGFDLKPGPLRKIVDQAKENPSTPYFLIIDEINRGNLAKIFGELYFLLEYRDRDIDLLYATDDNVGFTLPKNVFIIGTMNTADRSIALVDSAMRRRFAFEALHPATEPTAGLLRRWLKAEQLPGEAADLLDALNARIEDPEFKIGPSYFMKPGGQTREGIARVWRTSIMPLLEEHHYGELTAAEVEQRYGLDAIRARINASGPDDVEQTVTESGTDAPDTY
jgi:5-methylcytosine-specific restriction enzyme B